MSTAPQVSGWSRILKGNRLMWLVAGASVVCLAAGYAAGALMSPATSTAGSAKAGPITVPVEHRALENTVKLRGDATFDDAVEVRVASGDLEGPAVVTGNVPEVGATLDALSVALEVAGRPVIVLPGALPAYRTLRAGHSGPDVVQLKEALRAVGIDPGDSDSYDAATANAITALYQRVGYSAPSPGAVAKSSLDSAKEAVQGAEMSLSAAENELAIAAKGPDAARRLELDNGVREAARELAAARATGDARAIARAEDDVQLAQAQRDVGLAPADTRAQSGAVQAARTQLAAARAALADANAAVLTPLPANEIQFLPTLPRRVDEVSTARGTILEGAAMVVSGATLSIAATADAADAKLLSEGAPAVVEMSGGTELPAVVRTISQPNATSGKEDAKAGKRWRVDLALTSLTDKQVQQLRGQNVRVTIPVTATDGKVLVVPAAALTAGPGGESRVELAEGDRTRVVPVQTGLAADGLVEITGAIKADDLVVVGR
ncbi:hypothetical protein ACPPVW_08445 [Leifsonia sp. McL0607]|uniref:hypothetical protein n=1 Tax=Leifsonia sp. McL0607 TaxID=3415672 RepID=UPI003CF07633